MNRLVKATWSLQHKTPAWREKEWFIVDVLSVFFFFLDQQSVLCLTNLICLKISLFGQGGTLWVSTARYTITTLVSLWQKYSLLVSKAFHNESTLTALALTDSKTQQSQKVFSAYLSPLREGKKGELVCSSTKHACLHWIPKPYLVTPGNTYHLLRNNVPKQTHPSRGNQPIQAEEL